MSVFLLYIAQEMRYTARAGRDLTFQRARNQIAPGMNNNTLKPNMKKTIIALMALAGVASAYTTVDVTADSQFYKDNNIGAEYILTLNLNVSELSSFLGTLDTDNEAAIFAVVQSGGNLNGVSLGKWGGGDVYLQTPNSAVENALNAGATGGVAVNGQKLDLNASSDCALSVTNMGAEFAWTSVESASITLYHQGVENLTTVTMNLTMDGGEKYTIMGSTSNSFRAWDAYGDTTTLKYNTNLVSSYTLKFIPEPATATLSLLALCGLAARRRRK